MPALDIGGTHVSAGVVDCVDSVVGVRSVHNVPLDAHSDEATLTAAFASAARAAAERVHPTWAIAIPGPFDYDTGIGDFRGVSKFSRLRGVDLRRSLRRHTPFVYAEIAFINDAEAYAIGEWLVAGEPERFLAVTLGTGIGSGFLVGGEPVVSGAGVPPGGNLHETTFRGKPLEEHVSRRAIVKAYAAKSSLERDVAEIFERARSGEVVAYDVLREAYEALAQVLSDAIAAFAPSVVVFGGSISGSWDILHPLLSEAVSRRLTGPVPPFSAARNPETAPLLGAAYWAARSPRG